MSVALLGSLWRPGLPPGIYEEKPAVASRARVRLDVAAQRRQSRVSNSTRRLPTSPQVGSLRVVLD